MKSKNRNLAKISIFVLSFLVFNRTFAQFTQLKYGPMPDYDSSPMEDFARFVLPLAAMFLVPMAIVVFFIAGVIVLLRKIRRKKEK